MLYAKIYSFCRGVNFLGLEWNGGVYDEVMPQKIIMIISLIKKKMG